MADVAGVESCDRLGVRSVSASAESVGVSGPVSDRAARMNAMEPSLPSEARGHHHVARWGAQGPVIGLRIRAISIMVSSPLPPLRRAASARMSSRACPRPPRSTALFLGGAVMVLAGGACLSGGPVGGMRVVSAPPAISADGDAAVRLVAEVTPLVTVTSGGVRVASGAGSAGNSGGADGSSGDTCAGDGSCGAAPPLVAGKASSGSGGGSSGSTQKSSHDTSSGSAPDSDTQASSGGFLGWLKKLFNLDTAPAPSSSGADSDAPVGRAQGAPQGSSHGGAGRAGGDAGTSSGAATSDSPEDGLVPGQTKAQSPAATGSGASGGKSSAFAGKSSSSSADGKSSAQASSGEAGGAIENLLTSVMSGVSKLISSILSG